MPGDAESAIGRIGVKRSSLRNIDGEDMIDILGLRLEGDAALLVDQSHGRDIVGLPVDFK